jgi:hypothetical protein
MKRLTFTALLLGIFTVTAVANPPEVSEKVLKIFNETYTTAVEVKWYSYEQYYEATFKQNEIPVTVRYDTEGTILSSKRYYNEQQLNPFIAGKLKAKYAGKTIFGVTERTSENGTEYYVVLEDEKFWWNVKADAGGVVESAEKIKKG